jgi:MHS family proline/betaine transporter-like MFS transporter
MKRSQPILFSAVWGNVLEYYDFTVYSVFSSSIGHAFFPAQSEFPPILLSLAVFAVGFVTRPIGGILFGYIGDKYGRRMSLMVSILGMTVPTLTIGLIPSYAEIGIYAPIILVIMRLTQGLCLSGEGAGTAIFVLEHHKNFRPGLTTGLVHGSNIAGTLIASFIGIVIEQYFFGVTFAWRFAFILGGFMGAIGFYLRLKVSETPIFNMLAKKKQTLKTPFLQVLKTARIPMFLTFCTGAITSSVVYMAKTYVNVFYHNVLHLDNTTALIYLFYVSFVLMVSMPISGLIGDIIGKLRMIIISSILIFCLGLPTLYLMASPYVLSQVFALTILGILAGAVSGTAYIFVISLFTPAQRYTGVAFSYNLGIAIFGGTSPMISSWLVEKTGLFYSPAFYIMATSSIFLIIIWFMKDIVKKLIPE